MEKLFSSGLFLCPSKDSSLEIAGIMEQVDSKFVSLSIGRKCHSVITDSDGEKQCLDRDGNQVKNDYIQDKVVAMILNNKGHRYDDEHIPHIVNVSELIYLDSGFNYPTQSLVRL